MSDINTISAEKRDVQGTGASRRLRHAGKIPAILYGGNADPVMLTLDHDTTFHAFEREAFHSSILDIDIEGNKEKAILRDVQMHPFKNLILHVDFQRVSASDKIHMNVPLHFSGGDECPGVKLEGGVISHLITELDVSCLPGNLPEYIEVDISGLKLGESVHISELNLPEGVESTVMTHGGDDLAVVTCAAVRGSAAAGEAEEVEAEGEEAAGEEAGEE